MQGVIRGIKDKNLCDLDQVHANLAISWEEN